MPTRIAMPPDPAQPAAAVSAPATPSGPQAMAASSSVASRRRSKGAFGYAAFIISPSSLRVRELRRANHEASWWVERSTDRCGENRQRTRSPRYSRNRVQTPARFTPEQHLPRHVRVRCLPLLADARADLDPGLPRADHRGGGLSGTRTDAEGPAR